HRLSVGPDAKAGVGQAFPGEHRARVELAQGRDVAVADDVSRLDAVALHDVLEQYDQRLDLRLAVGVPHAPGGGVGEARVDDLDADGSGVEPGPALPLAVAGMPGATTFIHQLIDG